MIHEILLLCALVFSPIAIVALLVQYIWIPFPLRFLLIVAGMSGVILNLPDLTEALFSVGRS